MEDEADISAGGNETMSSADSSGSLATRDPLLILITENSIRINYV